MITCHFNRKIGQVSFKSVLSLAVFALVSGGVSNAQECPSKLRYEKYLNAISCPWLHDTYLEISDKLEQHQLDSGRSGAVSDFFLSTLNGWETDFDRLPEGSLRVYSKKCDISDGNTESIHLELYQSDSNRQEWRYDISLAINDVKFADRGIKPSADYLKTQAEFENAARSFSLILKGRELTEIFESGGFAVERVYDNHREIILYKASVKKDDCRMIHQIMIDQNVPFPFRIGNFHADENDNIIYN